MASCNHVFIMIVVYSARRPFGPCSYGSWIYNYLCSQCLSPLMLWVRISIKTRCTILCDKLCQWLVTGQWFSPGPSISSTNKIDHHDITEILWIVVLNTIKQTIALQVQWNIYVWILLLNTLRLNFKRLSINYFLFLFVVWNWNHFCCMN
jgi:hypothetical protein